MKSNDIGRKVKVTKSGTFNGLEGEIIEVKATVRFPHLGEWSFSYYDLVLTGIEKANEPKISPIKEPSNESEVQVSMKEKWGALIINATRIEY